MKLSIVIPCLNEAETITRAVRKAAFAGVMSCKDDFEVVVADNGSTDGSVELVKKQGIARVISVPVKGYGAALHWGISKSKGTHVLFADADLSYDFLEVVKFMKVSPPADLVLGSRFLGEIKPGAMPTLHRYLGTPVLTVLIRLLYSLPVSDSNSGMRMIKRALYKKLLMRNSGMEWASELLIKVALAKGSYAEVPITLWPDQRSRPPHLLSWVDGWRHLKAIILLKPNSLLAGIIPVGILGAYSSNPELSEVCSVVVFGGLLALLAAKLLQFSIDGTKSLSVSLLLRIPLVLVAGFVSFFYLVCIVLEISEVVELSSYVILFDLWVFHIETIKTHLLHRLPDSLL